MKPNLTRDTQQFVDQLAAQNSPPLYTLSYEQARKVLIDAQSTPIDKPDCEIHDIDLPVGPTGKVPTRIVRPKDHKGGPLPVVFYIHGGGWVMGNRETHDRLVRKIATGAKAAVVYPEYTNSPEAQYPVPLEQCYAVLEHVVKHAASMKLDASRLAICGDSAGGNMSTVVALMARDRKGPEIRFQALLYPVTQYAFDTQSYTDFADGPWLTKKAMEWFWAAYVGDKNQAGDLYVSPNKAPADKLKGLPPALIIVDENDVLRDEGEAYARKLIEAGVDVACVRFNGTHHDFMMLNGLAHTAPTREAILLTAKTLRKVLHKGSGPESGNK